MKSKSGMSRIPIIADFLNPYKNRHFVREDGSYDLTTNLKIITSILTSKYHLALNGQKQVLPHDVLVLPMESFIAKDSMTGWIMADESTYAIHHYAASWYKDRAHSGVLCSLSLSDCSFSHQTRMAWYFPVYF
ncbi:hypothetical protein [uncultured Mitsuokella sp.]|uniref:hypothetical protein n=1 Tax=uncultured Mitsuokella sp. TaxID=453120 RepID=UPI0025990D5F|nr:hypothetical protein [uncultured Mitsuokella sp.]